MEPSWRTVVQTKRDARDIAVKCQLSTTNTRDERRLSITNIQDIQNLVAKLDSGELRAREVIEAYIARYKVNHTPFICQLMNLKGSSST